MDTIDCPKCGPDTDAEEPCAECRRHIHESWHLVGWGFVRWEECHADCPGRIKEQQQKQEATDAT